MSTDPETIQIVEVECPFCGAKIDKNYGNIYLCGTEIESQIRSTTCWSRETRSLNSELWRAEDELNAFKDRLFEAETLLQQIRFDLCTTNINPTLVGLIQKINTFLNPPNPADGPNNCLACMGATGPAVQHTCK